MCGRYWIDGDDPAVTAIIGDLQDKNPHMKCSGEIFPGDTAPVVCKNRRGGISAFAMEWGFALPDGKRVINARMETAHQKPMFRDSMRERRCVLPMSAYFEWEKLEKGKQKHRIYPDAEGLFCLAGLYRFENGAPKFTVLTMEAAEEIAFIHPRMPLILPWEQREEWLFGGENVWQLKMKFEEEQNQS